MIEVDIAEFIQELPEERLDVYFKVIDEKLENSDGDGVLSKEELQSFYKLLDGFDGTGLGEEDGKFDIDGVDNFINWLIENNFSEDELNEARDLVKSKMYWYLD